MESLLKKISIEEIDNKSYHLTLYEPAEKAVLTHYLHNYPNGVSEFYEKDALKVLDSFVEYKNTNSQTTLNKEIAFQQLLFEVENVPFPTPTFHPKGFRDKVPVEAPGVAPCAD